MREVHAYPPSTGRLALYTKGDFYEFVDFAVATYRGIEEQALEPLFKNSSFVLCAEELRHVNITNKLTMSISNDLKTTCLTLDNDALIDFNNTMNWFSDANYTINWYALERVKIRFNLTSIAFHSLGPDPSPDCFQFRVHIDLENAKHDGQMPINLINTPVRLQCPGQSQESGLHYYSKS